MGKKNECSLCSIWLISLALALGVFLVTALPMIISPRLDGVYANIFGSIIGGLTGGVCTIAAALIAASQVKRQMRDGILNRESDRLERRIRFIKNTLRFYDALKEGIDETEVLTNQNEYAAVLFEGFCVKRFSLDRMSEREAMAEWFSGEEREIIETEAARLRWIRSRVQRNVDNRNACRKFEGFTTKLQLDGKHDEAATYRATLEKMEENLRSSILRLRFLYSELEEAIAHFNEEIVSSQSRLRDIKQELDHYFQELIEVTK